MSAFLGSIINVGGKVDFPVCLTPIFHKKMDINTYILHYQSYKNR